MKHLKLATLALLAAGLLGPSCVIAIGTGPDRSEPSCCEAAERLGIECPECATEREQCCADAAALGKECELCEDDL